MRNDLTYAPLCLIRMWAPTKGKANPMNIPKLGQQVTAWMHLNKSRTRGRCVYSWQLQAFKAHKQGTPRAPFELDGPAVMLANVKATRNSLSWVQKITHRHVFLHVNGTVCETLTQSGQTWAQAGKLRLLGQLTVDPRGKDKPAEYEFVWAHNRQPAGWEWPVVLLTKDGAFAAEWKI